MSWQSYIDNLKSTGHIDNAAIVGVPDGNVWAQGPGFDLQSSEIQALIKGFGSSGALSQSGIKANGQKYFFLQSSDDGIQGKRGQTGITISKAKTCMIVGTYNENQQPGNARNAVEKMVDYLKSVNM